ncbi:hypothetical protein S245_040003 [Arachis hypogaea]
MQQLDQQVVKNHLSYNAMHGTSGPAIIRIKALINGLEIQVFIDACSSDNFILPRIAKFLNLPIEQAPGFKVIMGNFTVMSVERCISSVEISIQDCKVNIPEVYVLHLAGGDMVISTTWLKQLRAHIVDYDASFVRSCMTDNL